jgi:molecular chaperone DnaK
VAYIVFDYFQKQGFDLIEHSLRGAEGKLCSVVTDDRKYHQNVIQRGWFGLPMPIRMLGRSFLRWDEFYRTLREQCYDLSGDVVAVRPEMPARVRQFVRTFYGPPARSSTEQKGAASPIRGAPEDSSAPSPPLATPAAAAPPFVVMPSKPSRSGADSSHDIPVGIDLGTTYSVVAYVDDEGRPCSLPNAAGDLLTPSVVLFGDEGTIVGKEALLASAREPDRVAECVKRDMGAKAYHKKIKDEFLPPEVISSLILRSLKTDAEHALGSVHRAVITVPAYFEETRRRATMDAGRLAGLEVLDIINEPTAAAIAYGYQLGYLDRSGQLASERPLRVLVYDLGGGTFDVSIVEIQGKSFRVLATDGDVGLGGKDWDERLIAIAAERFRQRYREDPRNHPVSHQELWLAGEAAKRILTERPEASIYVSHLGCRLKVQVTRAEFEETTADLINRTRLTTEIVIRQAGLTWPAIDRVLLVGGATRMPMVVRMLEELTGKAPDHSLAVDEAVAHGAALFANLLAPRPILSNGPSEFSVTNVNSHSLGITAKDPATGRKRNQILLPKNSPLPRTVTQAFKTYRQNQHSVEIEVLEGESERPQMCSRVGHCAIRDLPAELPAGWPIQVSYTYEANGRLHVTAQLQGYPRSVTTDFRYANRMPDEDLQLWTRCIEEEMRASAAARPQPRVRKHRVRRSAIATAPGAAGPDG